MSIGEKRFAYGQVKDPSAEVREFFEQVGTFSLTRANLEPGSWPFEEAQDFEPSALLAPEPVAPDPTLLVRGQNPVVWNQEER